jgi:hypothetical protein
MHGKTHLTHHNLFILSTPISPSHSATRPKACHASKRDVPPYSRTHLFSKSKDYLSLICRSGMLSGSALQMHMHACRQRRRETPQKRRLLKRAFQRRVRYILLSPSLRHFVFLRLEGSSYNQLPRLDVCKVPYVGNTGCVFFTRRSFDFDYRSPILWGSGRVIRCIRLGIALLYRRHTTLVALPCRLRFVRFTTRLTLDRR